MTLLDLLRRPEIRIALISHTKPIAKKFLQQLKQEAETNEELKSLFPEIFWENPRRQAPKWSEDDGLIFRRTSNPKEPTVYATGLVDGMPTSFHVDLRVYDDVVTDKSVTTPEMVAKTTEMLDLSQNLGSPGDAERYIGTRYDFADTYQTMIERQMVKVRLYPATHDGTETGKPVLMTQKEWDRHRLKQPLTIAAQMLQNPAGGKSKMFDAKWLTGYWIRPSTLHVYILVDPSKGRGASSDRTAMAVIGVDAAENRWLLDGYCHRMNLAERWECLKALYRRWIAEPGVRMVQVGYEQYGLQVDLEHFSQQMRLEKLAFPIEEVNWVQEGSQSKVARVSRLVPDLMAGKWMIPHVTRFEGRPQQWRSTPEGKVEFFDPWRRAMARREAAREAALQEGKPLPPPLTEDMRPDETQGFLGEPREVTALRRQGLNYRIAQPIVRLDENGQAYDLTRWFIDEILYFPFGTRKDLVDACSRIYDMQPTAPQTYSREDLEPPVYVDT